MDLIPSWNTARYLSFVLTQSICWLPVTLLSFNMSSKGLLCSHHMNYVIAHGPLGVVDMKGVGGRDLIIGQMSKKHETPVQMVQELCHPGKTPSSYPLWTSCRGHLTPAKTSPACRVSRKMISSDREHTKPAVHQTRPEHFLTLGVDWVVLSDNTTLVTRRLLNSYLPIFQLCFVKNLLLCKSHCRLAQRGYLL